MTHKPPIALPRDVTAAARNRRLDEKARDLTDTALETLREIVEDDSYKASDRISAAKDILDRGHGKPLQAHIALPATRHALAAALGMDDAELLALASSPEPPIEAEFTEVDPLIEFERAIAGTPDAKLDDMNAYDPLLL